jgi:lysophospholipase L1-like esterase
LLKDKFRGALEKADEQQQRYRDLAGQLGITFFSMADVAEPSPIDGVHLDEAGQQKLGEAMATVVADVLER